MNRKIGWESCCHDEIELVYEKAAENENASSLLSELEEMALQEAEQYCGLLNLNGQPITKEMFARMSPSDKERVMHALAGVGLEGFFASMTEPVITVTLSTYIQIVLGCTMFSILNRLEKLDGAYNVVRFPQATLKILAPLGGKKGLIKCKMLIMMLYPWLSISEESTNAVAVTVSAPNPPSANPVTPPAANNNPAPTERKGFFSKLFKK